MQISHSTSDLHRTLMSARAADEPSEAKSGSVGVHSEVKVENHRNITPSSKRPVTTLQINVVTVRAPSSVYC